MQHVKKIPTKGWQPQLVLTVCLHRALGDVFSQKIEGTKRTDYKRAMMTAGYGIAFIGAQAATPPSSDDAMQATMVCSGQAQEPQPCDAQVLWGTAGTSGWTDLPRGASG